MPNSPRLAQNPALWLLVTLSMSVLSIASPEPASADSDQVALSAICANNVANGLMSAYVTDSNFALVACGGIHNDFQFVAQKSGATWSLLLSAVGRLDNAAMTSHGVPSEIAETLLTVIPAETKSNSTPIPHVVVVNETFDPAVQINGTEWLVNLVTFTGIDSGSGIVMRIPCTASDPKAGKGHITEIKPPYYNYGCTAQVIPIGRYKGLLITQFGQIMAAPPQ